MKGSLCASSELKQRPSFQKRNWSFQPSRLSESAGIDFEIWIDHESSRDILTRFT